MIKQDSIITSDPAVPLHASGANSNTVSQSAAHDQFTCISLQAKP